MQSRCSCEDIEDLVVTSHIIVMNVFYETLVALFNSKKYEMETDFFIYFFLTWCNLDLCHRLKINEFIGLYFNYLVLTSKDMYIIQN